jgi:hypothetical protein
LLRHPAACKPLRFHFIIGRGFSRQVARFLCPTRDAAKFRRSKKAGQRMTAAHNSSDKLSDYRKMRVAFQGESGAFSEEASVQLLGEGIITVPRPTFDAAFRAISDGLADALLAPVENTLAGPVVRVYDLLLESALTITAETILPIEHHLIGCPGATLDSIRSVASHPMALAQCERFFATHPHLKRVPAEDTAGSVREALASGDKTSATSRTTPKTSPVSFCCVPPTNRSRLRQTPAKCPLLCAWPIVPAPSLPPSNPLPNTASISKK